MGLKRWLCIVPLRLRSIFHCHQVDSELDEELQYHLDMKIEEGVVKGMSREEARRFALLALGGLDQRKEECRDTRGVGWLDNTQRNLAFLFRSLRRSPGYAISVIVTLALGIGAVTAIFSAVDQTVLRKPFPHYERFAVFGSDYLNFGFISISYPIQVMPCVERGKSFEAFAISAWARGTMNTGSETFGVDYGSVNQDFFSLLNGKAALGRLFHPEEFATDPSSVMVLKHQFWKEYFGGDPNIIGRSVVLENRTYQIVGVLSKEFSAPDMFRNDVFMPLVLTSDPVSLQRRVFATVVRLRQGVTLVQANAEASILCAAPNANPAFKERYKKSPLYLKSLSETDPNMRFSIIHGAFLSAVGFLLAIACINGVNLMLVRLSERRRELGIRSALGGSRGRMMCLIITESLALNLVAGLLGLILAWMMKPFILSILTNSEKTLAQGISLDSRAVFVAFGICLLSALIIAVVPTWKLPIQDPQSILRESGIAFSEGRKLGRLRGSLVVICAAMAMVLLTGTGLMTRSVQKLMSVNRGFDPSRKIVFWIDLPRPLQLAEPRHNLAQRLEERLQNFPGITNVSTTAVVPLTGATSTDLSRPDGSTLVVGFNPVSPTYFRSMAMKLLKGRWLPSRPEGLSGVMLINASLASKWFGAEDPIGRSIKIETGKSWEVIGVVSDIRDQLRKKDPQPQYYFPNWQDSNRSDVISLMLDLSVKPSPALIQSIRKAIHNVEPQAGVRVPVELQERARMEINKERFTLFVLELISAISMLLAVLGLFSVMAYSVSQRMKEFGIRLAIGATARQVFISVLRRGFALGGLGIVIGLFGSWTLTRYIKSLLFETSQLDPFVYITTVLLMLSAVFLACWLPARKGARADLSSLLKME
jgi:predicted permease